MSRYFFFDNAVIPSEYEKTVPQVFPTTAPGNFTWLPEIGHYVMTTFYPYQWDLNYKNPRVFNEMMYNSSIWQIRELISFELMQCHIYGRNSIRHAEICRRYIQLCV